MNWDGFNFGTEIVFKLRTIYKYNKPIVFFSLFALPKLQESFKKDIQFKLIYAPKSYFVQLPINNEKLEALNINYQNILPSELLDINMMFCNLKGILSDKLNHDLSFNSNIELIFQNVYNYLDTEVVKTLRLKEYEQLLNKNVLDNNSIEFNTNKNLLKSIITNHFSVAYDNSIFAEKQKHKILFLEDNIEVINSINDVFTQYFNFQYCTQTEDALKIIKEDKNNEVVCVIADWRLYTDETSTFCQDTQGYAFLEKITSKGIRYLISLTSQDDFLVNEIRNVSQANFKVYKKEIWLKSTESIIAFAEQISSFCEEINNLKSTMPRSKTWTSKIRKKNTFQYSLQELYSEFITNKRLDISKNLYKTLDDIDELSNHITIDLEHKINNGMESLFPTISTTTIDNEHLYNILIARRVVLVLFKNLSKSINDVDKVYAIIYMIVQNSSHLKNIEEFTGDKDNFVQLINNICLLKRDLSDFTRLLPEERNWLANK